MPYLACPVVYTPADGSPDLAGLVTHLNPDGSMKLAVFPPNREAATVDAATEGMGANTYRAAAAI
jgi:hypothetical protein